MGWDSKYGCLPDADPIAERMQWRASLDCSVLKQVPKYNYLDMCLRKSRLVLYYISLRFYWDGSQNTAACLMLTLLLKRCSEGLVWTVQFSSRSQNVSEKPNGQHWSSQWIDLADPASGLGYIHKYCCYLETYSLTWSVL